MYVEYVWINVINIYYIGWCNLIVISLIIVFSMSDWPVINVTLRTDNYYSTVYNAWFGMGEKIQMKQKMSEDDSMNVNK